jgi:hypothetical protein
MESERLLFTSEGFLVLAVIAPDDSLRLCIRVGGLHFHHAIRRNAIQPAGNTRFELWQAYAVVIMQRLCHTYII